MKKKEFLKAFELYEIAIKTIDEGLIEITNNYKKQVLLQKRFELLAWAETITKLVKNNKIAKRTSAFLSFSFQKIKPTETSLLSKEKSEPQCDDRVSIIEKSGITWSNQYHRLMQAG